MTQIQLFDTAYVDCFAGGGGASTGIELATGHPVDVAINHDESAIMMHQRNHPYTEHYKEDIWMIEPDDVVRGRHVRLAWFSPDCKHFSRAKGAALVDKHIRGLAWVVLKWAAKVRPDVILLENVPEFVTWGPVRKGKPVKKKAGTTYARWRAQLEALGYKIESEELCAADYGAPTIRKRFYLVARCDGRPIRFPERTHAPRNSPEVKAGLLKPWRAAAEIVDWSLPVYSIFDSAEHIKERYGARVLRPLKENTLRRIALGCDKFVIKAQEPFILQGKFQNAPQSADGPLTTITSVGAHEIVLPYVSQYHKSETDPRGQIVQDPLMTVDASNRYGLTYAYLTEYFSTGRPLDVKDPMHTLTALDRQGLVCASVSKYFTGVDGSNANDPLPTVTGVDHNSLMLSHLAHFKGSDKGQDARDPLLSITAADGQFAVIRTTVEKYAPDAGLGHWDKVRDLLNKFAGYTLASDEVLLLWIGGNAYVIVDVALRMFTPRELYNAMGFPADYIFDKDIHGRPISRADQVARCGNAVCPAVAKALVEANLPEECKSGISTMEQLKNIMVS